MRKQGSRTQVLLRGESGQSLVEYSLLVVLVALAAAASVHGIGLWLSNLFGWLAYASQFLN